MAAAKGQSAAASGATRLMIVKRERVVALQTRQLKQMTAMEKMAAVRHLMPVEHKIADGGTEEAGNTWYDEEDEEDIFIISFAAGKQQKRCPPPCTQ
ncbi:hypothetical protein NDU88_004575 [Pleurodeles waltl]|uniref:Uncharacterized protein n=1 Tax=Pleurodeles waltl TaxID=8319 RepID=A0AAV7L0A5_PLEWA|nr:hypothetical protein NDU88_004575 [Pleurodeles waltl]